MPTRWQDIPENESPNTRAVRRAIEESGPSFVVAAIICDLNNNEEYGSKDLREALRHLEEAQIELEDFGL